MTVEGKEEKTHPEDADIDIECRALHNHQCSCVAILNAPCLLDMDINAPDRWAETQNTENTAEWYILTWHIPPRVKWWPWLYQFKREREVAHWSLVKTKECLFLPLPVARHSKSDTDLP